MAILEKTLRWKLRTSGIISGVAWDRDFKTQRIYFTICCWRNLHSISWIVWFFWIFGKLLKTPFPHCKIDKIWISPEFGQKPLGGPLTATVNGKVVLDALIWCLAVSGVDFVSFLKSSFWSLLILIHIYGRFLDFGPGTLSWKLCGAGIRSGLAWDRDFKTQRIYVTIYCPELIDSISLILFNSLYFFRIFEKSISAL